ncbi:MAG: large conductance mechanosensitive channel protein MscL [Planctomycetaceae bacterium]
MEPFKKLTEIDPARVTFSLYDEFRKFAFKGNVIDLAVGVVIGGAFAKIIDSLVKNIIMPAVTLLMPVEQSYLQLKFPQTEKGIPYGLFIGDVVNFLIVAVALFIFIVKFLGWMTRNRTTAPAVPPTTKDQLLLAEIRDLLKQRTA